MDISIIEKYKEKLLEAWGSLLQKSDEDQIAGLGRERIIVFVVAFILAMALWMMVNLNRDYTLNLELPLQLGGVPTEMALAEELPNSATVSVTGEGWKLINLYNNPPNLNIDVDNKEVNLLDQVQQQMNAMPNVSIQNVQPRVLSVNLDNRISKKIPIRSNVNVSFADQYDFVIPPEFDPDSVTINGAASLVENIEAWDTDTVDINGVRQDIEQIIPLHSASELVSLSLDQVNYSAEVAQYTEAEVEANITTQNLPSGRIVSYSPLAVTIKYDVPIDEYADIKDENPFEVYVPYQKIIEDSTGFVTPVIEERDEKYYIKLRSFQPRRVAYYMVLDN